MAREHSTASTWLGRERLRVGGISTLTSFYSCVPEVSYLCLPLTKLDWKPEILEATSSRQRSPTEAVPTAASWRGTQKAESGDKQKTNLMGTDDVYICISVYTDIYISLYTHIMYLYVNYLYLSKCFQVSQPLVKLLCSSASHFPSL